MLLFLLPTQSTSSYHVPTYNPHRLFLRHHNNRQSNYNQSNLAISYRKKTSLAKHPFLLRPNLKLKIKLNLSLSHSYSLNLNLSLSLNLILFPLFNKIYRLSLHLFSQLETTT